jgi:micrococcal nuclease
VTAASARTLALALALAALGSLGGCASDDSFEGVVERVVDGDTIVLTTGETVRYLMVNTPEITGGKNECYGQNAARFNSDLVLGKTVRLTLDVEPTDIYDRTLAYVSVGDQEVNRLLVERGFACVLHIPPNGADRRAEFQELEASAKAAMRGLWGACDPIPCR